MTAKPSETSLKKVDPIRTRAITFLQVHGSEHDTDTFEGMLEFMCAFARALPTVVDQATAPGVSEESLIVAREIVEFRHDFADQLTDEDMIVAIANAIDQAKASQDSEELIDLATAAAVKRFGWDQAPNVENLVQSGNSLIHALKVAWGNAYYGEQMYELRDFEKALAHFDKK